MRTVTKYNRYRPQGIGYTRKMDGPLRRQGQVANFRAGMQPNYRIPIPLKLNRRGVASPETGYVDLAGANYEFSTTGSITLIATIAQGASVNQRIGKKVAYRSLQCRGNLVAGSTGTVADAALLIVYDRRPTGALPAITDILVAINSSSMNNDANSGRFKIMKRLDFNVMGNSTTPATGGEQCSGDFYLKMRNLPLVFKAAATGAIGDIEEGAIYLVTIGDHATGTTAPIGALVFRTRFIDT